MKKYKIKNGYVPRMGDREGLDIDWSKGQKVSFPNLKPSMTSISLRLPETMLSHLKILANRRAVPYQSLIKVMLSQAIDAELHKKHA
ncbi:MAG: CopG family antitoxin [Verrucomicrobiota bacterium]